MKILFLHDHALDSNKANVIQVLHMCYSVNQLGYNITLAVPSDKKANKDKLNHCASDNLGKPVNFTIIPYHKFTVGGRLTMIGGALGAKRLLKITNTDCCLTRNPIYAHLAISAGIPTIFESHNSLIHSNRLLNGFLTRNLLKYCKSNKLLKFVTISQNLADFWIKQGVPKEKVLSLHDGIDAENYLHIPEQSAIRKKLALPSDKKIVVYAGSLYPDREIENILTLAKTQPEILFVMIGGPNANADFFRIQASELEISNIIFYGQVKHSSVKDFLFAGDILLMVWSKKVRTMNYCSPMKVFEYMATGRTIVGHGFPTILEVLTDGQNALLANPDSFEELKSKLSKALKMPLNNKIGSAARKLALDKYTWKKRAEKMLSDINNIGLT